MARDKGRMDLKKDIREALEPYFPDDTDIIGPGGATFAVMRAVLPHFELAYERGVMAERSRGGYKIPNPRKESE